MPSLAPDPTQPWLLLLDFDGTITQRDADFEIADRCRGDRPQGYYLPLAQAYERLEIGMHTYFQGLLDMMDLTPRQLAQHALTVPLRPGAGRLVARCRAAGWQVRILSEGLEVYIEPMLRHAGLQGVPLSCNRARYQAGRWRVEPGPDARACERCLNCKGHHVRRAQERGLRVAVVGNSASDLCAARRADLVLARDVLQEHCVREDIPSLVWESFDDVLRALVPEAGLPPI